MKNVLGSIQMIRRNGLDRLYISSALPKNYDETQFNLTNTFYCFVWAGGQAVRPLFPEMAIFNYLMLDKDMEMKYAACQYVLQHIINIGGSLQVSMK